MAKLKASFKNISEEQKLKFKQSKCLLTISVGQAYHEGELFGKTIELINRHFNSCTILIGDSLQRHTMAINSAKAAEFFYKDSITQGDLWLKRNEKYYSKLTNLKEILRWNMWLNHPNFEDYSLKIKQLLQNEEAYRDAFSASINKYVQKYTERVQDKNTFNADRAMHLTLDFVIEECAALCLWPELGCEFEVYSSLRNQAMDETHKGGLPKYHLLYPIKIRFSHAEDQKPQNLFTYRQVCFGELDDDQ